jgi:hypothetical protein
MGCIETMKLNKYMVAKLMKGESVVAFRRKQMVMKWNDEKGTTFVSTLHEDCMVPVQTRKGQILIPSVVIN